MKKFLTMIAATMLTASPALAQPANCGTAAQAQAIINEFKEIPLVTYSDEHGNIIMVYGNLDTGTSTVFMSPPNQDLYCIISQGTGLVVGGPKRRPQPGPRPAPTWNGKKGDVRFTR